MIARKCGRDVAQRVERGALSKSLPAVRFRTPLGAGFYAEVLCFPPLNIGTLL